MTTATIDWPSWLSVTSTSKRVKCGNEVDEVMMSVPCETSLTETTGDNGTMHDCAWHDLMVRVEISDAVAARLAPDAYEKTPKIIAAAFRRRVWRRHLERCNEVNGYGWDEDTLSKIEVTRGQGDEDGQRRWLDGIKEVFGIALTDEQVANVLQAVRDYKLETQELSA